MGGTSGTSGTRGQVPSPRELLTSKKGLETSLGLFSMTKGLSSRVVNEWLLREFSNL